MEFNSTKRLTKTSSSLVEMKELKFGYKTSIYPPKYNRHDSYENLNTVPAGSSEDASWNPENEIITCNIPMKRKKKSLSMGEYLFLKIEMDKERLKNEIELKEKEVGVKEVDLKEEEMDIL